MSFLRQIYTDAARPDCDVASLLSNCKILAARLGSKELARWADQELNGYQSKDVPFYRILNPVYYASFAGPQGRVAKMPIPIVVIPAKYRSLFSSIHFASGISKIEAFASNENGTESPLPDLAPIVQGNIYPTLECQMVWAEIPQTDFRQLLTSVKSRILDFALEIERENPDADGDFGEGLRPPPEGNIHNHFYGSVGNLAQHSHDFTQTSQQAVDDAFIQTLLSQLSSHLHELPLSDRDKRLAELQIESLRTQGEGTPDPTLIHSFGKSLRSILESSIAGVLSAGAVNPHIWQAIQEMLKTF